MKKALITGVTGQDGAYLAKLLLEKGYHVCGGKRRSSTAGTWRLHELGIADSVELVPFELLESESIQRTLKKLAPDEVYNLAAQSFVGVSFEMPAFTGQANGMAVCHILEALRDLPGVRFYQASTSELFGQTTAWPQSETTPFHPRSPYSIAKQFAHSTTINYREAFQMFASTGILFNHESPMRGVEFVTRKITVGLAQFSLGEGRPLRLGNLDAKRDWGFAGDYVQGMWQILNHDEPDDFVLATGQAHSVREFVDAVGLELGLEIHWEGAGIQEVGKDQNGRTVAEVVPEFFRPAEVGFLLGDSSKAKCAFGWAPKVDFVELAQMMARADAKRVSSGVLLE